MASMSPSEGQITDCTTTSTTAPGNSRKSKRKLSKNRSATPRTRLRTRSGSSGVVRSRGSVTWAPWTRRRHQKLTTRLVSKPKNVLTPPRRMSPPTMPSLLLIMTTTNTRVHMHQHAPIPLPLHRKVVITRTRTTTRWLRRRRILSSTNLLSRFQLFSLHPSTFGRTGRGKCNIETQIHIEPERL